MGNEAANGKLAAWRYSDNPDANHRTCSATQEAGSDEDETAPTKKKGKKSPSGSGVLTKSMGPATKVMIARGEPNR